VSITIEPVTPSTADLHQTANGLSGCRVCGEIKGKQFTANGYEWRRCTKCEAVYKVLTHQQYLDLNPSYDPGAYLDSASPEQIERFLRIEAATETIDSVTRRYVASNTVNGAKRSFLDVGCGMGTYLVAAQRLGFDVIGFEPSADHAYVAKKHLNLPVIAAHFSRERVGDRTFDLIMLSHVIEHIYIPKVFLHELISVLKPGGALIVVTPNSDSLVARVTGRLWPMLKPVDHVTMICAKTYSYFELEGIADVRHWDTEYTYEFAATIAAVVKAKINRRNTPAETSTCITNASPPPLRALSFKAEILKALLTIASAPVWLAAAVTHKRACLNSAIVRSAVVPTPISPETTA
jgi:2-polyprenyl-3-methyl-5-hydroxy-6-metoxy-1,4-benzoquinol methylase